VSIIINKGKKKTDLHGKIILNLIILLKFDYKIPKKIYLEVQYNEKNTV
jgi:hypothetical protein